MQAWNVSVLTDPTSDTEPTLIVDFGTAKYAFNAGEGAGRAWLGSHHSIRKTKALFVTAAGTQRCGGVPGLLMLYADGAVPKLEIFGPYGLMHYLATMRGYTYRPTMTVKAVEAPSAPVQSLESGEKPPPVLFRDENLTVYAIPLYPSTSASQKPDSYSAEDVAEPASASAPPAESPISADRPLKRKRTPSPEGPSKRRSPPITDHTVDSASPVAAALVERARWPDFEPSELTGEDAQEWRKLILQDMFPYQETDASDTVLSKEEKEKARIAQAQARKTIGPTDIDAPPRSLRVLSPDKRYARLPRLAEGGDVRTPSTLPTLAYLLVGPSVRGKFDAQKAEELCVPRGPIRGLLTKGETITFEVVDEQGRIIQRTVRPEECVGPSQVGQSVLILDVPTPEHIPSLMASFTESPFYAKYRSKDIDMRKKHPVHAVFHLCGDGVLEDERYKEFMNGFSDETYHVVSSKEHTADKIVFGRSALVQAKLNQLDPEMFPIPKYSLKPARDFAVVGGLPPKAVLSYRDLQVHVRPPRPPAKDGRTKEDEFAPIADSDILPELSSSLQEKFTELKAKVNARISRRSPAAQPGDDIVITPLGTGSAVPTKLRNVSGTLIQIPGRGTILLDCGEGTWGQLARSFGDDPARTSGVWQVLRDIKCIFLSHMHGDHHMGVSKILQMRTLMNPPPSEPVYVVGLRYHLMYLVERQEVEDLGLADPNGVVMILSDALNWRPPRLYGRVQPQDEPFMNAETSLEKARAMCHALGLKSFTAVDVMHRVRCYGCVMRHEDGWGIAFSADTMPAENLIRVGRDATLLIHESSMSPEEEALAREKAHSTSAQAIDVGRRMGARKLLLTHFSARYPGMPPRRGGRDGTGFPLVGVALDFSRIRLGDMWKLNMYLPAIQHTFDELGEEDPVEIDLTKLQ
ncbi:hypothetical protein BV20DRAFT_964716 [Pilatotrama ljubarskyi]|nr:hypothetical protein BV20DRAFT_964716 [Pilatotrama ljubarskyi]